MPLQRAAPTPRAAPQNPGDAYRATPKPPRDQRPPAHYRLHYNRLDTKGKIAIHRAGRIRHLGVGTPRAHRNAS